MEEIADEGDCGRRFELYDPDGNRITVWQAGLRTGDEGNY